MFLLRCQLVHQYCLYYPPPPLSAETPIIILEYAARGNLLNTLRQRRGASDRLKRQLRELSSFTSDDGYSSTQKGPRKITYHRYTWHTSMPKAADLLRPDHVYELARQIARGMAFLASQKVRTELSVCSHIT